MAADRGAPSEPSQDDWAEAVGGDLAERLDAFAFEREKVLDKLDVKGARLARSLAMELRTVRRALTAMPSDLTEPSTREMVTLFRDLRTHARDVLSGKPVASVNLTPPPSSGERDRKSNPDEITALRSPESLRSGSRKRK